MLTNMTPAADAARQKEITAVKPVVALLKATGWYFGSHTWGHVNLSTTKLDAFKGDTERWFAEVGSLIGPTKLLFYPFGSRPDGDDVNKTGPIFKYLQSVGFRVFASVGIDSFSKIKTDIDAVICDRMHADGRHAADVAEQISQVLRCKARLRCGCPPQLRCHLGYVNPGEALTLTLGQAVIRSIALSETLAVNRIVDEALSVAVTLTETRTFTIAPRPLRNPRPRRHPRLRYLRRIPALRRRRLWYCHRRRDNAPPRLLPQYASANATARFLPGGLCRVTFRRGNS